MTLLLEDVEKVIQMALDSHTEEVHNYLERVNSIMIPPPRGSQLYPTKDDQAAMDLAKGVCAAQIIMGKVTDGEFEITHSWLTMFVAGYVYERVDIKSFMNMNPLRTDWTEAGCMDLTPPVCQKIKDVLIEKMPTLTSGGLTTEELGLTASWVAGRRIGRYVADGEEAAAIFAASMGEGSDG